MLSVRIGLRPWTQARPLCRSFSVSIPRLNTEESEWTPEQLAQARQWLDRFQPSDIPREEFEVSFSRSSGPGGQKVNKTSSKATVTLEFHKWLDPHYCRWIPVAVAAQLREKPIRYQTKFGGVTIQSDLTRNRETNTDECFRKLLEEINEKVEFAGETSAETVEKWEDIKADKKEKRLFNKKKQSDKKKARSKKLSL
ncbi:hypothetical protein DICA3_C11430 [Diutina catenulata]